MAHTVRAVFELVRRFPVIVLMVAVGVGGYVFRDHLTGYVGDLRVSDCFDEPEAFAAGTTDEVEDVQHRPCSDPHDGEVFAVVNHHAGSSSAYPTEDAFGDFVGNNCVPAFEAYTGRLYREATEFDIGWFYPGPEGWDDGDRVVTCYVYRVDGSPLQGSVKAATAQ